MRILTASDVQRLLPMKTAIAAMREAFLALHEGRAVVPERTVVESSGTTTLTMPALLRSNGRETMIVKIVTVTPTNAACGLPTIQGVVFVLDPSDGKPVAMIDAASLTAVRTAAASGLATELLSREESRVLFVFGAGIQARTHMEAICAVRPIDMIWVTAPRPEKVAAMIAEMRGKLGVRIEAARDLVASVGQADIVCTTTTSCVPVFDDADLMRSAHINAVGSFKPDVAEVPVETVCSAFVCVDHRDAAWKEAGDLIQPLESGLIEKSHVKADLGELVAGGIPAGVRDSLTLFKSVGLAVQDAAAAAACLAGT